MSRRALFIVMFVSLALNLFVLGAAAGVYLFGPRLHRPPLLPHGPAGAMMAAGATLPADRQDAYRETLRAEALRAGPQLREARQIRRDAWMRLGADPVDMAGVTAGLDRARALETQARAEFDRTLVEFAAKLPAAERAKLGQALAQPPRLHREPRPRAAP